jgi:hypothetical protein
MPLFIDSFPGQFSFGGGALISKSIFLNLHSGIQPILPVLTTRKFNDTINKRQNVNNY